jgi:hypothetical protein
MLWLISKKEYPNGACGVKAAEFRRFCPSNLIIRAQEGN